MKRLLILVCLFIGIVLSGCGPSYDTTVTLSRENFNEHFNVDFEIVEEDGNYKIVVKLEPRFELKIININVKGFFSYYYYSPIHNNFISEDMQLEFDDPNIETHIKTFAIGKITEYKYLKVTAFGAVECAGEIKTYEIPMYQTKGFVTNVKKNNKKLSNMTDTLAKLDSLPEGDNFSVKVAVSTKQLTNEGNGVLDSERIATKMRLDPFYLESEAEYLKTVYKYNGNKLYSYLINENNHVYIEQVSMPEITQVSIHDLLDDANLDVDFSFDATKLKITDSNEGYLITGYYKDFLTEAQYQAQLKQLNAYGSDAESLLNEALCKIYLKANDEEIHLDLVVDIFLNTTLYLLSVRCIIDISFIAFDEVDFNDNSYYFPPPSDSRDVKIKTDLSKKVTGYINAYNHVYLVDLEKGQYIIDNFHNDIYRVYIIDRYQNSINNVIELSNFNNIKYTFPITKAGEYYIILNFKNSIDNSQYDIQISKIKNNQVNGLESPIKIKQGLLEFAIVDFYNIIAFQYSAIKPSIIVLKSLNPNEAVFYQGNAYPIAKDDKSKDTYIFAVYDGFMNFYAYGPFANYQYQVTIYEKDKYVVDNPAYKLESLVWTDNLVLSSNFQDSYIDIDVDVDGTISFESDITIGNISNLSVNIYDDSGYLRYSGSLNYIDEYIFSAGIYRMEIRAYEPTVVKLRYSITPNNE